VFPYGGVGNYQHRFKVEFFEDNQKTFEQPFMMSVGNDEFWPANLSASSLPSPDGFLWRTPAATGFSTIKQVIPIRVNASANKVQWPLPDLNPINAWSLGFFFAVMSMNTPF